ncbi:hypothetical protein RHGRI_005217 [Rhododendron griersonianum]|uniref:Uncharacterized protein n=1 Tax=Rhododendron griersonianum TaxID=479676 RepID=A0AAV6LEM1_9ERIC|nr:hypothetical protein RHGRI_005217 [Rhododendron griersonianum]
MVKYVVFDKTGTLTQGKASVTTARVFTGMERGEFLTLVASAEASSEHPLAKAIVEYARHFHFFDEPSTTKDTQNRSKESKFSSWLLDVSDFSALPGRGVQCFIDGKQILVGNRKLPTENGICIPTFAEDFVVELEESAKTGILVAYDSALIGVLGVADPLKREAVVVVEGLVKMGVKPVMVTEDNWRTARAVAREDVRAEVMPAGKADVIRSSQKDGSIVAMVGDGINDSPALAAADIGMAIGAGTDIAIEAADYVLMRNNLEDVITAIDLSRKTFSRIRLNYVFAMAYNVIAIPIAAGVLFPWLKIKLPPWAAGACMALSSVRLVELYRGYVTTTSSSVSTSDMLSPRNSVLVQVANRTTVRDLSYSTTESCLRDEFSTYGQVAEDGRLVFVELAKPGRNAFRGYPKTCGPSPQEKIPVLSKRKKKEKISVPKQEEASE